LLLASHRVFHRKHSPLKTQCDIVNDNELQRYSDWGDIIMGYENLPRGGRLFHIGGELLFRR